MGIPDLRRCCSEWEYRRCDLQASDYSSAQMKKRRLSLGFQVGSQRQHRSTVTEPKPYRDRSQYSSIPPSTHARSGVPALDLNRKEPPN